MEKTRKQPATGTEIKHGFVTICNRVYDLHYPAQLEAAVQAAQLQKNQARYNFNQVLEAKAEADIRLHISRSHLMRCTRRLTDIKAFSLQLREEASHA